MKSDYFIGEYKEYHDTLVGNEDLVSRAQSVLSDVSTIMDRYNNLVSFVEGSN